MRLWDPDPLATIPFLLMLSPVKLYPLGINCQKNPPIEKAIVSAIVHCKQREIKALQKERFSPHIPLKLNLYRLNMKYYDFFSDFYIKWLTADKRRCLILLALIHSCSNKLGIREMTCRTICTWAFLKGLSLCFPFDSLRKTVDLVSSAHKDGQQKSLRVSGNRHRTEVLRVCLWLGLVFFIFFFFS